MEKKRIFIACGDERLRIALLLRLENEPGMAVVGFTDRLESLLPQLVASQANILLLEWQLTPEALRDLLTKIHALQNQQKIICFAHNLEEKQKILGAVADHVILTNAPPDDLIPTLNKIDIESTKV